MHHAEFSHQQMVDTRPSRMARDPSVLFHFEAIHSQLGSAVPKQPLDSASTESTQEDYLDRHRLGLGVHEETSVAGLEQLADDEQMVPRRANRAR